MSAIHIESTCKGFYKLTAHVLDDAGNISSSRELTGWFPNLITDSGLEFMGNDSTYLNACQTGTGNTAPAVTDTALATYLAGTTNKQTTSSNILGSSPFYVGLVITYRFGVGVSTGNISEVGVGKTSATGSLYSRALVLDGGGAPTTVTVLANEVLDVTYELRVYPPLSDTVGVVTISGVNYDYTVRGINANAANTTVLGKWGIPNEGTSFTDGRDSGLAQVSAAYNGSMVAINVATPTGTSDSATSYTSVAYVGGSLTRDGIITFGLNDGNLAGGITVVTYGFGWCTYQCGFSPAIPKDGTKTLSLTFRHTWARAVIP